jgi:hypothetical protein
MAEVEDTSNKLGVDTFKLMHLINKTEDNETPIAAQGQDDISMGSNSTQSKTNMLNWHTSCM